MCLIILIVSSLPVAVDKSLLWRTTCLPETHTCTCYKYCRISLLHAEEIRIPQNRTLRCNL